MAIIYFQDIDIYGREESNGKPYLLNNEEAIQNALTLWISSKAGDFIRNPEAGGLLDRILFKNMEGQSVGLFMFALKNALYKEFEPAIKVIDVKLEKLYQYRTIKIEITYQIISSNIIQKVEIFTKDITPIIEQKEQVISLTGANLRMFCLIRQPFMDGQLLIYNEDEDVWRWGIYKLDSFTTNDEYYDEILEICNG